MTQERARAYMSGHYVPPLADFEQVTTIPRWRVMGAVAQELIGVVGAAVGALLTAGGLLLKFRQADFKNQQDIRKELISVQLEVLGISRERRALEDQIDGLRDDLRAANDKCDGLEERLSATQEQLTAAQVLGTERQRQLDAAREELGATKARVAAVEVKVDGHEKKWNGGA